MDEIWKDIKGYEGHYQASNLGRVRSLDRYVYTAKGTKILKKSMILSPCVRKDGNVTISLTKNRVTTIYVLSRIIYSTFNPDFQYSNKEIVIGHKDEDVTNNKLSNLYETIRKINPNLNINIDNFKRSVICITTNKRFNSLTEASKYYNTYKEGVSNCCNYKRKSAGKLEDGTPLVWMYLDKYKKMTKEEIDLKLHIAIKTSQTTSRRVFCITTGKEFNSIVEASKYYNINKDSISMCCGNKLKSSGKLEDGTKLVWMYLEDYKKASKEEIDLKIDNANKTRENPKLRKKVMCVTTGEKFESIAEANKRYNISKGKISNVCSGKKKSTGKLPDGTKLVWKYLDEE
jgi:hypothetical protein